LKVNASTRGGQSERGVRVSEQQVEPPVQLGSAAANPARSIWRQRALVLVGLVLGAEGASTDALKDIEIADGVVVTDLGATERNRRAAE
jgi:hypothetical protein